MGEVGLLGRDGSGKYSPTKLEKGSGRGATEWLTPKALIQTKLPN